MYILIPVDFLMLHNITKYIYRVVTDLFSFNNSIYSNKRVDVCTVLDPVEKALARKQGPWLQKPFYAQSSFLGPVSEDPKCPCSSSLSFQKN